MPVSEKHSYRKKSRVDDDFQEYPTLDVLEQTRSRFSTMSINKKITHCSSTKADDDADEKYQKSFEAIQELTQVGEVDKLKLDQCKIYLKHYGLRMAGNKSILIQRIKEHIQSSMKADDDADDADDIEVDQEVEFVVPELDEKDQKTYEAIQKLIDEGMVDKLKLDQCKIYLKKHGLRMAGNKNTLIQRIKEHIDILDGGGERKYRASSFVLNCKGDACTGDIVMFEQNVYEMFSVASRSATGPPCGTRTVAGRIIKESYGTAKQQHTFTIEVLWSNGEKPLPPLHPLLIKGRNLYRIKTMRQKWEDEGERWKILSEKHARGAVARSNREERVMSKSKRAPCTKSKHGNDKMGPILQHPHQQERYECKNHQKENNFLVNDKREPMSQHPPHFQLQQGWNEKKNHQKDNHFHGDDKRGPLLQNPPPVKLHQGRHTVRNQQKDNHFHGNDKMGLILQHPPPQERYECKNQQKENHFHVNDKIEPNLQHPPHVQLQQGLNENKNHQKYNHFHGHDTRGPILQHPPPVKLQQERDNKANQSKQNRFHRNYYFQTNGQRMSNNVFNPHPSGNNHHHYQRRHPFTHINRESSITYGGRRHPSNCMDNGESSRIPYGTMHHLTSRRNTEYAVEIQYGARHP